MNTSALKSFAPAVRRQLMEAVTRKLDYVLTGDTPDLRAAAEQVKSLRKEADRDRTTLIERVAYTWFNRLAAIRFLDARGWHPFHARVLTPATAEETQPELLKLVRAGSLPAELSPHTDPDRLNDLLDGRLPTAIAGADPQGEVYRHLVLAVCRFYHATLPFLFEQLNDETELLLPDDLLTATSVAEGFRTEISDDDCKDVEILGWLYQFYISEKKDNVMARNAAVPKEDIPAVTQLFTPHWIVRYLVENSLGRLWLLNRPQSRLREHMPYYIKGEPETDFLKIAQPEDIRLLDPAAGSAHMLTYAFDLLVKIYEEEGYPPSQIAELILTHNLHGLDICPRAAQLAQFALLCKAREVSRSAFRRAVAPKVLCLEEVRFEENELHDYVRALGLGDLFDQPVLKMLHQFEEAKSFGSLIQPCLDERAISDIRRAIEAKELGDQLFLRETHRKVLLVLEQAEALTQRYHVAVANPPYFGPKQMGASLKDFAKSHFPNSKTDLYAMFMERGFSLAKNNGYCAMVTMQSWMFLHSFEAFRIEVLSTKTILSLAHLGARAFDTISGEIVTVAAFCCANRYLDGYNSTFFRLVDGNETIKDEALRERRNCYSHVSQKEFAAIPGSPVAYWIGDQVRAAFKNQHVFDLTISDGQNITADNERFVRNHWEVGSTTIGKGEKWLLYAKGGPFRRWYGNLEAVVDWSPEARAHYRRDGSARIIPEYLWYRQGITWSRVGTALAGFRLLPENTTFDKVGSSVFLKSDDDKYLLLGLLNSPLAQTVLDLLNPSIDIQVKDVRNVPLPNDLNRQLVQELVSPSISIAKDDWDNFESSWDFRDQPLLRPGLKGATLEASWRNWQAQSTAAIRRMQELETENNRLFIAAYGLDGELQPEVPEEQITLARADQTKDAAALLSYAVGCMMGRYSLDQPGLILADAGATVEDYLSKVPKATFAPDEDGIIPVLDGEWFPDDVVARTREFLKAAWGAAHLDENMAWLEQALGKDLRKYFLRDFYKNHLSNERAYGYKKRPIYWLLTSPNGSFQALLYLHRYTRDTVNTLLNRYLREFIHKLDARLNHLANVEATTTSTREKTAARKEADKLRKSLKECQDWERDVVLPLAQQRIELDLDDGVKVNYQKFPGLLAKIAGLEKKEE
ncbi:MAG: BREX-1 system adenine-specific DNA-methyltransferase PglX [Chthoniobacterales bacterium]|nr:BREX-1 system adenine-specific DNA-methyltransferase PglX [Chthoniobacterales bacterium]